MNDKMRTTTLPSGKRDVPGLVRYGAYLGFVWGLFSWAAVSATKHVSPVVGLMETSLCTVQWAVGGWLVARAASLRLPWVGRLRRSRKTAADESPVGRLYGLTLLFYIFYANYLLHRFLIAGVYLFSPEGIALSSGISVLLLLPALLLYRRPLAPDGTVSITCFLVPLISGALFLLGRGTLSSMPPGSGRLPIALGLYLLGATAITLVMTWTGAPGIGKALRRAVPTVLVLVIMWGTHTHSLARLLEESRVVDDGAAREDQKSILLLSIDTVRPDHLSLYGYPFPTSPNLDRLARSSVVYDQAYSPTSWTLPAHASIFTGLYPIEHGAHYPTGARPGFTPGPMDSKLPTVASVLQAEGYATMAISANRLAVATEYGLDRGFDHVITTRRMTDKPMPFTTLKALARSIRTYFTLNTTREHDNATTITDRGIEWIDRNRKSRRPFFLFLNYLDPHLPYIAPKKFDVHGEAENRLGLFKEALTLYYAKRSRRVDLDEAERATLTRYYDMELAYMDHELGRLFDYLEEAGLLDEIWVFIVSDHGEFLGEHRRRGHGKALYEEVTRAVLVERPPGGVESGGRRVQRLASIVEIPRMISSAAGFTPPSTMVRNRPDLHQVVLGEKYLPVRDRHYGDRNDVGRLRAIWKDNWKWIIADPDGTEELYRLDTDPGESRDLSLDEEEVCSAMRDVYFSWLAGVIPAEQGVPDSADETQKRDDLRALGYLE